ncbi:hypothetical protein NCS57_00805600 [Fusarium keratoplasticum]|uniref:Uncharacterized protein n=1 Tax=Fusarium keratoplasticum TaxID=1328300 RepID=A0ACC0QSN4_9HYPO|nr:hypothetical protein NCS57_00805600 [Fusarium keratoplasticum]KAI8665829.1 hypothetical protein NCS57_00805600 [Fusarium keratoplasticum]
MFCQKLTGRAKVNVPSREDASMGGFQVEDSQTLRGDDDASIRDKEEEPKYGWVIVASVFFTNAHTWGLIGSYSVFLAHFLHSGQFSNPDPLTLAFVAGLSFSVALLVAPVVTCLNSYIGPRPTVFIGILVQTGGLIAASFSTRIWHLVLSQGLVFGAGVGFIVNTTVSIVPQWFHARRSFAVAVTTAGSGTGGLLYSLTTRTMIDNLGLAWAFRILSIVSLTVNGISNLFLKSRSTSVGAVHLGFDVSFFKRPDFCLFLAWGFFSQFGFGITVFSMADFAETMGFTPRQGSIASAIFNLSQAIGRPLIGLASDRYGRLNVGTVCTLTAALSTLLIWILAGKSFAGTIIYTLFGAFASNMWTTVAPIGVEVMGLQLLPSALSIFWFVLVLPTTFAMPIALSLKGQGDYPYLGVQLFTGFSYMAAFISVWFLRALKLYRIDSLQPFSELGDRASICHGEGVTSSTNRLTKLYEGLVSRRKV